MIIATAGHIDHGKSSLIKAITGVDTDRLPEEKKRGMSIDLGFAYKVTEGADSLGFIDVPGHEKFIKNMLAGVTGIDYAMLIVAADDGPMPQTIEHLAILDLLGIADGIIALTKIDRVHEERLKEVQIEILESVEGTFLENSDVFPVSSISGNGVQAIYAHLETMSELLCDRPQNGNFRLAVDRSFTVPGAGLVVTGSVFSGKINVGDDLVLSPQGTHVRVRGIHAQNKVSESGVVGERCAVNITGGQLNKAVIHRGGWLLSKELHAPIPRFDARIRVLPSEVRPLTHWTPVHVHLGAAEVPGRVAILEGKSIEPSENGLVQIVLDRKIGALKNDGFIIRDQSARRTIAGGKIIDPFSPARGRAKPERIKFLGAMENNTAEQALENLLAQMPMGVDLSLFSVAWNLTETELIDISNSVKMIKIPGDAGVVALLPKSFDMIGSLVFEALQNWHVSSPDKPGPSFDALRSNIEPRIPSIILKEVLRSFVAEKKVIYSAANYCLPGFESKLSGKDEVLWKSILPVLERGYMQPPVVHALSEDLELDPRVLEKFLIRIAKLGLVFQVAKNRFLLPKALLELANIVKVLGDQNEIFGVKEFRDQSGIGRNLAIEILEFFDKSGFTWRSGDVRKVLKPISEVFPTID